MALIGLFSIPQAIRLIEKDEGAVQRINSITDRILLPWKEIRPLIPTFIRSGLIGVFTGIIPGTGGDTACWFAYNEAKRFSDDKESFGKGNPYGLAAPEARKQRRRRGCAHSYHLSRHSGQFINGGASRRAYDSRDHARADTDD